MLGLELEQATLEAAEEASRRLPAAAWLSLNTSPDLITDQRFLPDLVARSPRRLVLEVTEHSVVPDYQALLAALERLDHGARLAVDDAGAGFASLRHIIELRPDFVKLDIGLIRGIDSDQARQSIVAGMVHFASTTGCVLIGEGIETEGERQTLQALGLTFGQGYLFGRPQALPAETVPAKAVEPRAPALVA